MRSKSVVDWKHRRPSPTVWYFASLYIFSVVNWFWIPPMINCGRPVKYIRITFARRWTTWGWLRRNNRRFYCTEARRRKGARGNRKNAQLWRLRDCFSRNVKSRHVLVLLNDFRRKYDKSCRGQRLPFPH